MGALQGAIVKPEEQALAVDDRVSPFTSELGY